MRPPNLRARFFPAPGVKFIFTYPKESRGLHMAFREILEEFWREEDGEMDEIEQEAFWEDI
jgi:hypothetical protein